MNTNTITRISTLAAAIGLTLSANAWALDDNHSQTVTYEVPELFLINVPAEGPSLTIVHANAGGETFSALQKTQTMNITSTVGATETRTISASLSEAMMPGVTLKVGLPQSGIGDGVGTTAEFTNTTGTDALTLMSGLKNYSGDATITYDLEATVQAGATGPKTPTLTFTISNT